MTLEQRLALMLGQRDIAIANLETQLEEARVQIAKLGGVEKAEQPLPQHKPNGGEVWAHDRAL